MFLRVYLRFQIFFQKNKHHLLIIEEREELEKISTYEIIIKETDFINNIFSHAAPTFIHHKKVVLQIM